MIVRDFTDRTRLEAELSHKLESLEREQEFTRDVVNVAPVIFLLVDIDGRLIRFNDTAQELFGFPDDERVRGKLWWEVFLPGGPAPGGGGVLLAHEGGGAPDRGPLRVADGRRSAAGDQRVPATGGRRRGQRPRVDLRPGPDGGDPPARGADGPARLPGRRCPRDAEPAHRRRAGRDGRGRGCQLRVPRADRLHRRGGDRREVLGSRRPAGAGRRGSGGRSRSRSRPA